MVNKMLMFCIMLLCVMIFLFEKVNVLLIIFEIDDKDVFMIFVVNFFVLFRIWSIKV